MLAVFADVSGAPEFLPTDRAILILLNGLRGSPPPVSQEEHSDGGLVADTRPFPLAQGRPPHPPYALVRPRHPAALIHGLLLRHQRRGPRPQAPPPGRERGEGGVRPDPYPAPPQPQGKVRGRVKRIVSHSTRDWVRSPTDQRGRTPAKHKASGRRGLPPACVAIVNNLLAQCGRAPVRRGMADPRPMLASN